MCISKTHPARFHRRLLNPPCVAFLAALLGFPVARADEAAAKAWQGVPEILARIVPPVFPERDFSIVAHGAKPGGETDCSAAFAATIAECAAAGGGRVIVPKGKYLSGPIHLRSNVNLHLEEGSEIIFSDRFEDYLPVVPVRVGGIEVMNYSPLIYARDCTNVAVTGKGHLNGNGERWWRWKGRETSKQVAMGAAGVPVEKRVFGSPDAAIRPNFLVLMNCRNVLLQDFTIGSGPCWTIHPVYCGNVTIRGVTVATEGPNNDGIDPDSCRDVLIENCTFSTGDDCVVLKSGYNEDGWRVGKPTENVIMRHCSGKRGHGGLVIGSEMSGGVRNVFMHDCDFEGTDRAIRIKSMRGRGGVVERVYARDVKATDMTREVVILNMDYGSDPNAPTNRKSPVFRDMCFERITGSGAPVAVRITGETDSPVENIRFERLELATKRGVLASFARGISFSDCTFETKEGPVFDLTDSSRVRISKVGGSPEAKVFLKLAGAESAAVEIESCPTAKGRIATGADVPADAVTIK